MWVTALWNHGWVPLQWGVVLGASLAAALFDLRSRRIPNLLTFPVLAAGLIYATVAGGWLGLADALSACILLALPYVLLFVYAGGGAGDAKLMAALGGWLGVINGLMALASVALAGVVMAIVWAIARRSVPTVLSNVTLIVSGTLAGWFRGGALGDSDGVVTRPSGLHAMPYGVAIFIGVCTAAAGVLIWRL